MKKISILMMPFLLFISAACSTSPAKLQKDSGQAQKTSADTPKIPINYKEKAKDSSVEIDYFVGHDHYRWIAQAKGEAVMAFNYLDRQLLKQGSIETQRFPDFLKKVADFVGTVPSKALDSTCRSPFVVTVRMGKDSQSARGCRSNDDGTLSKLVREGEFLLYSKK